MKGIYLEYNSPVKTNEEMRITLKLSNDYGFVTDVKVLFNRHGEEPGKEDIISLEYDRELSNERYSCFVGKKIFREACYHTFYISLKENGIERCIMYDWATKSVSFQDGKENLRFWECFSYLNSFRTPDWVKGGIVYQIFVDTFCCKDPPDFIKEKLVQWATFPKWEPDSDGEYRNDQYYGGNLKGIISKLPYIRSLGVTIIYLTPVLKGSSSNRYDTVDYEQIDEKIGTWDDLAELKRKANALGMKIVLDVVFNHASSESPLIQRYPGLFTNGFWWGYKTLVEFNKNNPKYFELLEKWIKKYCNYADGLRLDVADELPDNVLRFIRTVAKKYNVLIYILGEVWKHMVSGDHRGFLYGDELDGGMNYQFANAIHRLVRWKSFEYFNDIVANIKLLYPPEALDVSPIFLSSHDTPRIPNILVGDFMKEDPRFENVWSMEQDEFWYTDGKFDTLKFRTWEFEHDKFTPEKLKQAKRLQKVAVFLQYTLPGLPSIFAGDEVGVTGYKDPFNRKPFPWDNMDYDMYNFYAEIGNFRNSERETFSDSRRFGVSCEKLFLPPNDTLSLCTKHGSATDEIFSYNSESCVLSYNWEGDIGYLNCKVDLKNLKCFVYQNGKIKFAVN